jgi:putative Mg2+ transporter-C (MgtC) family protein
MGVTWHVTGVPALAAAAGGQGLKQVGELGLAFALSSLIGVEREWRHKSAGLRTHTLVGVGAALFVIVSKYGFGDVLGDGIVLDPSRVAAQIVSGIGFIGGGLIFVRGDAVRGLTTAAIVWVTAAIGMACGAGLALLALVVTAGHFVVVLGYPRLAAALPGSRYAVHGLQLVYADGRGVLREVLAECTRRGFAIVRVTTRRLEREAAVSATLELQGQPAAEPLAVALSDMDGVLEVHTTDPDAD